MPSADYSSDLEDYSDNEHLGLASDQSGDLSNDEETEEGHADLTAGQPGEVAAAAAEEPGAPEEQPEPSRLSQQRTVIEDIRFVYGSLYHR